MPPARQHFVSAASSHSTTDTRLFSALTALGILPVEMPMIYTGETRSGQPLMTWHLEARSQCGKYNTPEMIAAWHSVEWIKNNPEHPLAYIKAAFENMNTAVDHIKKPDHQMQIVQGRGGKLALLSPTDPRTTRETILRTIKR